MHTNGWCIVYDSDDVPHVYEDTLKSGYIEGHYKNSEGLLFRLGIDFFTTEQAALEGLRLEIKRAIAGHNLVVGLLESRLDETNAHLEDLHTQIRPRLWINSEDA